MELYEATNKISYQKNKLFLNFTTLSFTALQLKFRKTKHQNPIVNSCKTFNFNLLNFQTILCIFATQLNKG